MHWVEITDTTCHVYGQPANMMLPSYIEHLHLVSVRIFPHALPHVRTLRIEACNLTRVPTGLQNLRSLMFSLCAHVAALQDIMKAATQLRVLTVQNSNITELRDIPRTVRTCSVAKCILFRGHADWPAALTTLSLGHCEALTALPDSISALAALRTLEVISCPIVTLPDRLPPALQTLVVSWCTRLVRLPSSIGQLSELRHLTLNGSSRLRQLPLSIGNLARLQTLSLVACDTILPITVMWLAQLTVLTVMGCHWTVSHVRRACSTRNHAMKHVLLSLHCATFTKYQI